MKADRLIPGLILLVVGIVWLLVNLGVITPRTAMELWRWWPLFIVALGLLLLTGKGGAFPGCLVAGVVFLAVFAFIAMSSPKGPGVISEYSFRLGPAVESVRLEVTQHVGELRLSSLDDYFPSKQDGREMDLLRARFRAAEKPDIYHASNEGLEKVTVKDKTVGAGSFLGPGSSSRFELWLNGKVPADLTFQTGATRTELDLSRLQVRNLQVRTGAGDLTLRLGAWDGEITLDSGAGGITIFVPYNTGVRLWIAGGLVSVDGVSAGITGRGERYYESENLAGKTATVNIRITAGAGSVTFKPAVKGESI